VIEDLRASAYIALKDLRSYYLKPGTVSWGLLFPFVFALAFMLRRGGLTEWLAPGMIAIALFFGSTSMSAMSIVFERRIGSFERLLLFPVSYAGIALGKTLSSFLLGVVSVVPVLALAVAVLHSPPMHPLLFIAASVLAAFASSSFGVLLSFLVREPEQVIVVFNLVRFPMLFLADVIIPVSMMPGYLLPVVLVQPLTYMTEAVRYAYMGSYDVAPPIASFTVLLAMSIVFLYATGVVIGRDRP
jgi:ABC-2 type transport system permease protein